MSYIDQWSLDQHTQHFQKHLKADQVVVDKKSAGDGNMNFTYRLWLKDGSTVIIKQSPPFCGKFPAIPAPVERIEFETKYYHKMELSAILSSHSPQVLALDNIAKILYMEDLGAGLDFEFLYKKKPLAKEDLSSLMQYLDALHSGQFKAAYENTSMRQLNHAYIFDLPFKSNQDVNLDVLTPGLSKIALQVQKNAKVSEVAKKLGDIYLHEKKVLIHGDFYPKSWLRTDRGLFVIDPEFSFWGVGEFDYGVFLAHMAFSHSFKACFEKVHANLEKNSLDLSLTLSFCSVEILRRLLYVSQLPLHLNLVDKALLCDEAVRQLEGAHSFYQEMK